jgi:hypothetical protein
MTSAITAASNRSGSNGNARASPWRKAAPDAPARACAKASCGSDGSTPCTSAAPQRWISNSVKAPLPHPTSSRRLPGAAASQERKTSPTRWLPRAHPPFAGCTVIETKSRLRHRRRSPFYCRPASVASATPGMVLAPFWRRTCKPSWTLLMQVWTLARPSTSARHSKQAPIMQ